MLVWLDQDLCTGCGLCEEVAPEVFTIGDDGLPYVKEDGKIVEGQGGTDPVYAAVPERLVGAVVEAAEECPGELIFLEF